MKLGEAPGLIRVCEHGVAGVGAGGGRPGVSLWKLYATRADVR